MNGNGGYSGETVRAMARELYGIELTEDRAAEIARRPPRSLERRGAPDACPTSTRSWRALTGRWIEPARERPGA